MKTTFLAAASLAFFTLVSALPGTALAQPPPPELLDRLSHHAKSFEELSKRASYRVEQMTEELDGDGKVSSSRKDVARIESDGKTSRQIVESCVKDGKDVTAEEREKVAKEEAEEAKKKKSGDGDDLTLPFTSDEYVYDQVGVDAADPSRVEISFVPKKATKHTVEGKAWVDTTNGTIISAGVKMSKPPTFVDSVHFTAEFGAPTALGPAISRLTFEVKAGILFIKKHIRGEIKMSDYRIAP
jgi:outer membrane lipoprotein-sorting protein